MERMGFETVKPRVIRVMNNKPVTATIGRIQYRFKSTFEFQWACYLELLKRQGHILEWEYEPVKFDFWQFGYRNKPYEYTPDFRVTESNGCVVFHELKGYFETHDISRISRTKKHYDAMFDLVLQRLPKRSGKGSQLLARITPKVRRVIDGGAVLKQAKNAAEMVGAIIHEAE